MNRLFEIIPSILKLASQISGFK